MGLTIHYELAATGDEAHARKLVQQLRQAALDLPFQHVGEIVELRGDHCDYKKRADDDPYRWLLIQARTDIPLPVTPAERCRGVRRDMEVVPRPVRLPLRSFAASPSGYRASAGPQGRCLRHQGIVCRNRDSVSLSLPSLRKHQSCGGNGSQDRQARERR